MTYLGTDFSPDEYYLRYADRYINPHSDAIENILKYFLKYINPKVIDIGCGYGLGTMILHDLGIRNISGIDKSFEMVHRYNRETNYLACVGDFCDELPNANTAVAVHSIHLCPRSRLNVLKWRLYESGVKKFIVVSPIKRAIDGLNIPVIDITRAPSGQKHKTVWGWVLDLEK